MQSMWINWFLVLILCKSTGSTAAVNPDIKCPHDPRAHGVHRIMVWNLEPFEVWNLEPFEVFCDAKIAGPGWTVIARRTNRDLNFFRDWKDYKNGFGDIRGDFFIGLDKLHAITRAQTQELYVHLEDWEGNIRYAQYDEFYIESENDFYRISKLGAFTGDAGDSMDKGRNQKFTTYDRDNDVLKSGNCAHNLMGAWWYNQCGDSNLFGMYLKAYVATPTLNGMSWATYGGDYSLKVMQMMVRAK